MPRKFIVRKLRDNSYYHVFNQGVSKREIFADREDYEKWKFYFDIYTLPLEEVKLRFPKLPVRLFGKNLSHEVKVLSYCWMPDHFHLLLKQESSGAVPKLMKQMVNAYTTYYNSRHKKAGSVFAGRYRAVLIESEFLVLQMARYIHLNPLVAGLSADPRDYRWSSINDHSDSNELLGGFGSIEEWDKFHLDRGGYENNKEKIKHLMID